MNIGLSLNGKNDIDLNILSSKLSIDTWICADGGINHLKKYNLEPKVVLGDCDSSSELDNYNVIKFCTNKDLTDGQLALNYILDNYDNIDNIYVIGIMDDIRIEHFYANLVNFKHNKVKLITKNNLIMYTDSNIDIKYMDNCDYISIFNIGDIKGLSINNAKYNVDNIDIINSNFNGISNEFVNKNDIKITLNNGWLMIIYSFNYQN